MYDQIVIETKGIDNILWDQILKDFDDANFYQTWSYGKILWGEDNLSHIIIKYKNKIISIAQVRIIKIPFLKKGMAYITGGPLWKKKHEAENLENFKITIESLKIEYVDNRGLYLRIAPNILEDRKDIVKILESEKYVFNGRYAKYRTLLLDLDPTLDILRGNLNQKWRNRLNRSEKNNLKIIEGNNELLFEMFLKLQKDMLGRKYYKPNINYYKYKLINKNLPNKYKLHIMVCLHNNEPVSSAIVSQIGDTATYLLGATGNKGLEFYGSYLLQWHSIKYLKSIGCKWYDLGGINPIKNPGVYHFKNGINGIDVKYIGIYDVSNCNITKMLVKVSDYIRCKLK